MADSASLQSDSIKQGLKWLAGGFNAGCVPQSCTPPALLLSNPMALRSPTSLGGVRGSFGDCAVCPARVSPFTHCTPPSYTHFGYQREHASLKQQTRFGQVKFIAEKLFWGTNSQAWSFPGPRAWPAGSVTETFPGSSASPAAAVSLSPVSLQRLHQ